MEFRTGGQAEEGCGREGVRVTPNNCGVTLPRYVKAFGGQALSEGYITY